MFEIRAERVRLVGRVVLTPPRRDEDIAPYLSRFRIPHSVFRTRVIRQLHHVIEVACRVVAADVEERKLSGMFAGDAFEVLNALKLALERPVLVEGVPPDDLRRTQDTRGGAAGQPHVAGSAAADTPNQ